MFHEYYFLKLVHSTSNAEAKGRELHRQSIGPKSQAQY